MNVVGAFAVGVIVGLGLAAMLHGLFDEACDWFRTKKKDR